jgi:thymidylate synthase
MKVEKVKFEKYQAFSVEEYRRPGRGGNTTALHKHQMIIDGETYSFLALGTLQWVYKKDFVSFEWEWDNTGKYRNINKHTIRTWDSDGNETGPRGNSGWKPTLRSTPEKLPGGRWD